MGYAVANYPADNASIRYSHDEATGQLTTLTAPNNSTLSYTYDGSLALSETWSNSSVNGTVAQEYNNDFRVTAIHVNNDAVNYRYDKDGLITQTGELSLMRRADNGLLTQTQLGDVTSQRTYNAFAEMVQETVSKDSQIRYETHYQHDSLGRITQKVETIEGSTITYAYRYDLAGRLVEVQQNGTVTEAYSYDANGNRLTTETTTGSVTAQYDVQDRLTQYGNTTYHYTNNGELKQKNDHGQTTDYDYDVLGNLRSVNDGQQIDYVIDARNRRIGKKVNGQLVQGFLYLGNLNPVAELDGQGNVVSRFVYGSKANVPDYLLKNGNTYRIISDHLGSPRLVIDSDTGVVVQRMDYDAFGNVLFDSNPGFQPFGFAGGLYDVDTKLVRFGARDYDAQVGRWMAKDPILFAGGDSNLYGYVVSDPINYIDPRGLLLGTIVHKISSLFGKADEAIIAAKYTDGVEGIILQNTSSTEYDPTSIVKPLQNAAQIADGAQAASLGVMLSGMSTGGATAGIPLIGIGTYLGSSALLNQLELSFGTSVSEYWGKAFFNLLNDDCYNY